MRGTYQAIWPIHFFFLSFNISAFFFLTNAITITATKSFSLSIMSSSATAASPPKMTVTAAARAKVSVNSDTATGRLTLNQATRAQIDATLLGTKRKTSGKATAPKYFSNTKPQPLTGLLGLSTCNSAFLNNLLADVAKAKEDILRANDISSSPPSIKRRRISMENSSASGTDSPVQQVNKPFLLQQPANFLDLLWEESWMAPPKFGSVNVNPRLNLRPAQAPLVPVAPPRATLIPAKVSECFPQDEEEVVCNKGSSSDDTTVDTEESFGWYVDTDDDDAYPHYQSSLSDDSHRYGTHNSSIKGSTDHLAFSAPTAPKASNHDAEVEWAKAADTVDDVLGDLF